MKRLPVEPGDQSITDLPQTVRGGGRGGGGEIL